MDPAVLSSVVHLSDEALVARVKHLAAREREATCALIAHLAEVDARRLHLAEGCSSLFTYCVQVLQFSEHAAYGRIEAARAARRFPVVLERLADGSVNLTTIGLLAAHLTAENHRDLLDAARRKSKRQVEEIVVRWPPPPPVPASVRRLPAPRDTAASVAAPNDRAASPDPASHPDSTGSPDPAGYAQVLSPHLSSATLAPPSARPAVVVPLAPERYKVQFTASAETYEKLRLAQALLRHQIPDGDPAAIFDRALTALLQSLTKQKFAAMDRPRGSRGAVPRSRCIPAEVKRAVWKRDGGQCAFVNHTGRRCPERGFLEFHHVVPHSAGGEPTVANIELRCRAHNGYEAELYFGLHKPPMVREMRMPYMHSTVRLPRPWGDGSTSELGSDRVGAPPSSLPVPFSSA